MATNYGLEGLVMYPYLRKYVDAGFPRHVIQTLVAAAFDSIDAFHPVPLALTRDGVWTFGVSGERTLLINDLEMRADPLRAGEWLVRHYCPPATKGGA